MLTHNDRLWRVRHISIAEGASLWQKLTVAVFLLVMVGTLFSPEVRFIVWTGLFVLVFAVTGFFLAMVRKNGGVAVLPEGQVLDVMYRPVTVLSALYREAPVLCKHVHFLRRLQYPGRVHFVIILEEDDEETMKALPELGKLPENFEICIIPKDHPANRGKARALNYALEQQRKRGSLGEYLVLFDAEDEPEADQLIKAAKAFHLYPDTACFQAELRFFNRKENMFTRMSACNYALVHGLRDRALASLGCVVPLSGTSYYIRSRVFRRTGGFDDFNVTEDADMGVRLKRLGQKVMMLPSVTFEEATKSFWAQVRQYSRWEMGYIATLISHTRQPKKCLQDLGLLGSISFLVMFLGSRLTRTMAPFFWIMLLFGDKDSRSAVLGMAVMVALVFQSMAACAMTGQWELVPFVIFIPVHWVVVVFSSELRALWWIITGRMFKWDKTSHGVTQVQRTEMEEFPAALREGAV